MATSGTGAIATFGDMAKITNVVIDGTYNANQCVKYSDIWSTNVITFSLTSYVSAGAILGKMVYGETINFPAVITIAWNYTISSYTSGTTDFDTTYKTNQALTIKRYGGTASPAPSGGWIVSSAIFSSTGSDRITIDDESARVRTTYIIQLVN